MKLSLETEGDGIDVVISHISKDRDSVLFAKVKGVLREHIDDPYEAFRKGLKMIEEDKLKGNTNG